MITISLKDTEIPGPLKEMTVNYNPATEGNVFDEDLTVQEKAAILNGVFKDLLDSWGRLVVGDTDFQRAYLEG